MHIAHARQYIGIVELVDLVLFLSGIKTLLVGPYDVHWYGVSRNNYIL